jgi:hypothetical protein
MSKLTKTATNARNALIADAAIAFARDRLAAQLPGVKPRRRRPGGKALLLGGALAAAGAAVLLKRDKVAALLPGRSDEPAPPQQSTYTPPPVSNYDASGPVANTATAVPSPPAYESPSLDEAEEEAAAAAEAANIGGSVSDYAGSELGEDASPAEIPLAESGEGEDEGFEQAIDELRDAAEGAEEGESDEERSIDRAIEAQDNPLSGEVADPGTPPDDSDWRTWSGRSTN